LFQEPSTSTGTPAGDPPQASFCIASLNELAARATAIHMVTETVSDAISNFLYIIEQAGIAPAVDSSVLHSRELADHLRSIFESDYLSIDNTVLKRMSNTFGGCSFEIGGSANSREASRKIRIGLSSQSPDLVGEVVIRKSEGDDPMVVLTLDGICAPGSSHSRLRESLLARLGVTDLSQLQYHRHLGTSVLKKLEVPEDLAAKNLMIHYREKK